MRVLVVEDESALRETLKAHLTDAGFTVDVAQDGEEGLFAGQEYPLDVAIIDLGLPKLAGLEVIRRLRAAGKTFPILILTARDNWQDKVEGLQAGADDYVAKPFHFEEVLARVQALLRRSGGWASPELKCGAVVLDTRAQTVTVDGQPVELTTFEYRILEHLMLRAGEVISKSRAHGAALRPGLRARQQRHRGAGRAAAAQARSGGSPEAHRDAAGPRLPFRAGARSGLLTLGLPRRPGRAHRAFAQPPAAGLGCRAAGALLRRDDVGARQRDFGRCRIGSCRRCSTRRSCTLIAAAEPDPRAATTPPLNGLDARLATPDSGLYAQIRSDNQLWRSPSHGGGCADRFRPAAGAGRRTFSYARRPHAGCHREPRRSPSRMTRATRATL